MTQLGDCKAKCVATAGCVGIEHNPRGRGRCEVWTRSEGIQASIPLPGFTCLRLGEPSTTRPIGSLGTFESLGAGTACRGASPRDNSPNYYLRFSGASLDFCKRQCASGEGCQGIEFSGVSSSGRCEVWTRAIEASAAVSGFTCYTFTPPGVPALARRDTVALSGSPAFHGSWLRSPLQQPRPRLRTRAPARGGHVAARTGMGQPCCEDGYVCMAAARLRFLAGPGKTCPQLALEDGSMLRGLRKAFGTHSVDLLQLWLRCLTLQLQNTRSTAVAWPIKS